jgi:streptogramin lyase
MVVDSSGNVFVACTASVVIKITPAGVSSLFTGIPIPDTCSGIAIDSLDNIYISDLNNGIIYKVTPSAVQTIYGTSTEFPNSITIDSSDNIYCTNQNGTVDKILATGGTITLADLTTLGGGGNAIALDNYNNVYVADITNNVVYLIVQ